MKCLETSKENLYQEVRTYSQSQASVPVVNGLMNHYGKLIPFVG